MTEPILEVRNLCKSYGAVQATKDFSFSVERGELHAIIGPNGAGKTSLVNQITGDILSDSGQILFNGRDITRLRDHRRARMGIARSFQITHIFEEISVAENLALSIISHSGHNFRFWQNAMKSEVVERELAQALNRVDLSHRAHLPAKSLSHGEKRQLEVGMALTGKPRLLILDEPMAGMGPGGTVELSRLIQELKAEMTILLVEHDMEVVFSLADSVTVLVYGENLITGSPQKVRNDPEVKNAYLGEEG